MTSIEIILKQVKRALGFGIIKNTKTVNLRLLYDRITQAELEYKSLFEGLKKVHSRMDAVIDGYSWGEEETGVSKVSISDLTEFQNWVKDLLDKSEAKENSDG
jgi:hypothetical protein